jgi:lipopolysaccharide export system ATP-binding protein
VNDGRIFAAGLPSDIIENQSVRDIYLGKNFRL